MTIYSPGLFQELANDLYLVFVIGLMLFLLVGQYFRWVGLIREKHRSSLVVVTLVFVRTSGRCQLCLRLVDKLRLYQWSGNHRWVRRRLERVAMVRCYGATYQPIRDGRQPSALGRFLSNQRVRRLSYSRAHA